MADIRLISEHLEYSASAFVIQLFHNIARKDWTDCGVRVMRHPRTQPPVHFNLSSRIQHNRFVLSRQRMSHSVIGCSIVNSFSRSQLTKRLSVIYHRRCWQMAKRRSFNCRCPLVRNRMLQTPTRSQVWFRPFWNQERLKSSSIFSYWTVTNLVWLRTSKRLEFPSLIWW